MGKPSRLSKQVRGPEANSVERILEGVSHLSLTLVAHRADRRQERTQTMGFRIHPAVVAADQTHDVTRAEPEDVEVQTSARFENRFADLLKVNGVATHPVNEVFDLHHVAGQIQGWVVGDAVLDGPQEEACLGCVEDGRGQLDSLQGDVLADIGVPAWTGESETR